MTQGEIETIQNIINRLKMPRAGCATSITHSQVPGCETNVEGYESIARLYIETWLIGPLQCLLPGSGRDVELARSMSKR